MSQTSIRNDCRVAVANQRSCRSLCIMSNLCPKKNYEWNLIFKSCVHKTSLFECFTEYLFIPIGGWLLLLMMCHWRKSYPSPSTLLLWKVSSSKRVIACCASKRIISWAFLVHIQTHFLLMFSVSSPEELAVVGESPSVPFRHPYSMLHKGPLWEYYIFNCFPAFHFWL